MTSFKADDGKTWVVSTLLRLTETADVPLESYNWKRRVGARLSEPYSLVLGIDGREMRFVLSSPDLSFCQNDPIVQARVRRRLKGLLQSLCKGSH